MRGFFPLVFSALASAAAIAEPRQAPVVTVVSATSLGGNGCPTGKFSYTLSIDKTVGTLIFDVYRGYVGPTAPPDSREQFCDFAVVFRFPLGCTSGTITAIPGGYIQLGAGINGTFSSQYTISPGTLGPNPANLVFTSAQWAAGGDYTEVQAIPVKETIRNENERNVTFTARSRLFLTAPGPDVTGQFGVDHMDISISQPTVC
ncbi:hypothetical protein B0T22DRAFT_514475 [Podospora appendiculata]|uniref:Secreted protein n=1 Tax=Podospora appendiculata TaxID=314037 RepID=A0AAE0XC58_9PEZI|nr:hypothetical protein B0T22DRAFT_514475 [Podospora appendiculata]